jgi:nitroreductase
MATFDLGVVDRLLSTTRAVRRRLDLERPVGREMILECLRLSMQAPTGSNRQGWRWIVVTDPGTRGALADLYREGAGSYLAAGESEARARGAEQDARVFASARYLAERLQDVPVHVIPCIDASHLGANPPPAAWAGLMGSIFPAVWSFQLALRARGLGSCLTTLHLRAGERADRLLGLPAGIMQVGLLPVAYTAGTDFRPAERPPVEEVVRWEHW